jgi:hypothetical protein
MKKDFTVLEPFNKPKTVAPTMQGQSKEPHLHGVPYSFITNSKKRNLRIISRSLFHKRL